MVIRPASSFFLHLALIDKASATTTHYQHPLIWVATGRVGTVHRLSPTLLTNCVRFSLLQSHSLPDSITAVCSRYTLDSELLWSPIATPLLSLVVTCCACPSPACQGTHRSTLPRPPPSSQNFGTLHHEQQGPHLTSHLCRTTPIITITTRFRHYPSTVRCAKPFARPLALLITISSSTGFSSRHGLEPVYRGRPTPYRILVRDLLDTHVPRPARAIDTDATTPNVDTYPFVFPTFLHSTQAHATEFSIGRRHPPCG